MKSSVKGRLQSPVATPRRRIDTAIPKRSLSSLASLRRAARDCRACDLWKNATQTVFGEGAPYESARTRRAGELPDFPTKKRPTMRQEIHRPAHGKPQTVKTGSLERRPNAPQRPETRSVGLDELFILKP